MHMPKIHQFGWSLDNLEVDIYIDTENESGYFFVILQFTIEKKNTES